MLQLTKDTFEKQVLKSKTPVFVDFYADWCGPCKALAPIFETVSKEQKKVKFAKLNVDENRELAQKYDVMGIPCIIIFKDGKEVERLTGMQSYEALKEKASFANK